MARSDESDPLAATAPASDSSTAGVALVRGPQLAAGTQVGRYVIVEPLGSGGMGAVYAARDPELGRRVAIKLLHPHLADMQARLLREGQAIARLRHPNVVTIHDVGTHDGNLFIAMELVSGSTLHAWLEKKHTWQEVVATFTAAGRGLAAAHAAGLVHRDFKPDNVLLGDDGSIVVTDFGLARTAAQAEDPVAPRASQPQLVEITQSGAFVGTPAYMAPEQFRGDLVDARSDQFSFCVALFEALYGKRPFAGNTLAGLQDSVLHGDIAPRPPSSGVPAHVHAAIERGLSRDPAARFASIDELLAALAPARDKRRVWPYVAAGGVCVAAAVFALATRGSKPDPCKTVTAAIDNVWTLDARAKSGSHDVRMFDRFAQAWRADRTAACKAHTAKAAKQAACLDRAAVVFAQLVQSRTTASDGDLPLPSLRRCARGDDRDAVVSSVQKPAPLHAGLSPHGERFATLDDQRLTIESMATGLATESHDVPGAASLTRWTANDVIAMRDVTGTALLTLPLAAPRIETTPLPAATSFVSPDLQSAVAVLDGDIRLSTLHGAAPARVLGRLQPGRSVLAGAWSPDSTRFALLFGPVADPRVQLFDLPGPSVMEVSFGSGPPIEDILWHTNDRLLYASHGIWSVDLPRGGVAGSGAAELPEPAERRVAPGNHGEQLQLLTSNGTRVLARRVVATIELVRVHDGNKTVLPVNTDIIRVKGATTDTSRIAIECANSVGIIEWHTKQYTEVGEADDVIAADGMRILLVKGNRLFEVTDKTRREVTVLPPSTERRSLTCTAAGGTCALLSWGGSTPELRVLHGDTLGPPVRPVLPYRIRDIALSPDGTQIAYAGGPATALDTSDLATGALHALRWPSDPALCGETTLVAWPGDAGGSTLYASQDCRGGLSRIVARSTTGAGKPVFEGEGQITGFTPANGDLYLDLRREDSELVVIDDI